MNHEQLQRLAAQGEGTAIEFKKSSGELREAMTALCGMLNAFGTPGDALGRNVRGALRICRWFQGVLLYARGGS